MELIKPLEISGKIMTLIEESEKKLVLVSPYVKVGKWYKFKNTIAKARERGVDIEFYIRDDEKNLPSRDEVLELGITPILVPNLHAKLYMNETQAIVTSMNLLFSSDTNSLEIGYLTQAKNEYDEVFQFYSKHLARENAAMEEPDIEHWLDLIAEELEAKYRRLRINLDNNLVTINTGINTYEAFLAHEQKGNILRISGILSANQYDELSRRTEDLSRKIGLVVTTQAGSKGHYDLIWGTGTEMYSSRSIHDITLEEAKRLSLQVKNFVLMVDERKGAIR
jgi:phosphatidylserine/phosphatidylglycerophosphate/cardiolipin synthase-like enzyme